MTTRYRSPFLALVLVPLALYACGDDTAADGGGAGAGASDAGLLDAALPDAGEPDADEPDADAPDAKPSLCDTETRDDDYVAGMLKVGDNGYTVSLVSSDPGPPDMGDNTWMVKVLAPGGAPMDAVELDALPLMPDHGHGSSMTPIVTPSGADGLYEIAPVHLQMSGYWTIRIKIVDPVSAEELDRVTYGFCVSS